MPEHSNTALWRKYVGEWRIANDSLFLDSIDISAFTHRKIVVIRIRAEYNRFDSNGMPTDCNIELLRPSYSIENDKRLKDLLRQFFIDRRLLPVYEINGKFQSTLYALSLRRKQQ